MAIRKYKYSKSVKRKLDLYKPKYGFKSYKSYLKSKYWALVRREVLKRDRKKCTVCGSKKNLQVHHTTYAHKYREHEHLGDLLTTCKDCHYKFHLICEVK